MVVYVKNGANFGEEEVKLPEMEEEAMKRELEQR